MSEKTAKLEAELLELVGKEDAQSPGFEGPEKRLEINIRIPEDDERGLRNIPRSFWDECMKCLNGSIVSHMADSDNVHGEDYWDAYVITESSLFVSKTKVIVLTCGTTTLLQCVGFLLSGVRSYNYEVEYFQFSRKNYTYPEYQKPLHRDFNAETKFLKDLQVHGDAHVLGPISQDHYFFFAADNIERRDGMAINPEVDQDLIVNMYDIDMESAGVYWQPGLRQTDDGKLTSGLTALNNPEATPEDALAAEQEFARRVTTASGIREIFPNSKIQEKMFYPCGYSMNGIEGDAYHTIHITPESHCSYASFETNAPLNSYREILEKTISVFKPGRFTVMFFADYNSPISKENRRLAKELAVEDHISPQKEAYWKIDGYRNKCMCFHEFEPGYYVVLANYYRDGQSSVPPSPKPTISSIP